MSFKHITAKEQGAIALAKANNVQRATEDNTDFGKGVVGGIREHYSMQEELALHRKALAHLIAKYGAQNDEELAEFVEYNTLVEQIKADIKENEQEHK